MLSKKRLTGLAVFGYVFFVSTMANAQTLLNVSYDVSREFYKEYNAAFVAHYKKKPRARTSKWISLMQDPVHRLAL